MNAVRRLLPSPLTSSLRDKFRTCLFRGVLVVNLTAVLAIALHTGDPQRVVLGATALSVLLVALP